MLADVSESAKNFPSLIWLGSIFIAFLAPLYFMIAALSGVADQTLLNAAVFLVILGAVSLIFITFFWFMSRSNPDFKFGLIFPTMADEFAVAISWVAGAVLSFFISLANGASIIPLAPMFATTKAVTTDFAWVFMTTVGVSHMEELFFLMALPLFVILVLEILYRVTDQKLFRNIFVVIGAMIIVSAPLFAIFHVSSLALTLFGVSAIVFRSTLIGIVWSTNLIDSETMIRKLVRRSLAVAVTFAISFHLGNNIDKTLGCIQYAIVDGANQCVRFSATHAYSAWFGYMTSNLFGVITLLWFALIIFVAWVGMGRAAYKILGAIGAIPVLGRLIRG